MFYGEFDAKLIIWLVPEVFEAPRALSVAWNGPAAMVALSLVILVGLQLVSAL